jgi:hypothetical protein
MQAMFPCIGSAPRLTEDIACDTGFPPGVLR